MLTALGPLSAWKFQSVAIVGYTDSVGSAEANRDLSGRRAAAVADYLGQHGVSRIASRSAVEAREEPTAISDTEAGRAQNRRIEILVRPQSLSTPMRRLLTSITGGYPCLQSYWPS